MAMNKILCILPALALLGLIPAADADTIQERIERLQERIAELQERIDQSPDSEKVAKWEAKVDRLQERVAELEARQAKAAQTTAPPQERTARTTSDTTPPSVVSAGLSADLATLTIVFNEEVRRTDSNVNVFIEGDSDLTVRVSNRATSETIAIPIPEPLRPLVGDNPSLIIPDDTFRDAAGNGNARTNIPITIPDTTPPSFVSAELDLNTGVLEVVFDEVIDVSRIALRTWVLANPADLADTQFLGGSQLDSAADSETVTVTLSEAALDWVGDKSLRVFARGIFDPAGNIYATPPNGELVTVIPLTDDTPPVITVLGDNPLAHELGDAYIDPGATSDDGSPVATDASAVDVNVRGDYVVTYTATDGNGNEGTASRTVQVRDTTPPTVQSATLDASAGTLAIAFDEAIDVSDVATEEIGLGGYTLAYSSLDGTAPDSDTLVLAVSQAILDTIGGLESPALDFATGSVRDVAGNLLQAVTVPMTVTNAPTEDTPTEDTPTEDTPTEDTPTEEAATCSVSNGGNQDWRFTGPCGAMAPDSTPVIATVTIAADGRFGADPGTVELAKSGLMAFSVDFVNDGGRTYTVLADLISRNSWHAGADVRMPAGTTANAGTFIVDGHMEPGDTAYLVFGVEDDPRTPEFEPDMVLGDQVVKIRIVEPAG